MSDSLSGQASGAVFGFIDAEDADEGGFASICVFPDGLTHLSGVALNVEQIVDDLKHQTEVPTIRLDHLHMCGVRLAEDAPGLTRNLDQRARLHPLQARYFWQSQRRICTLRRDIDHLTADHSRSTARLRNGGDELCKHRCIRMGTFIRKDRESMGLQRIPRENRRCLVELKSSCTRE